MEPLAEPIEHECFQFRSRRGRSPSHGIDVQRADNHFREDPGTRCRAAKVAHELRMRPVRNSWDNQAFDISEDFIERRSYFRRDRVQLREDCSRLVIRRDPPLIDICAIISDPICESMKFVVKNVWRNVAELTDICTQMCLSTFHWRELEPAAILPPSTQSRPIPFESNRSPNG